ncbi:type I-A CRISPR-associated protein Cas5 [Candidatus Bathyarchaeota archaeon]|nr:type I-A CRISPR-associated protein Cas5 [Candidatus Bathyarchaeota archaeon]
MSEKELMKKYSREIIKRLEESIRLMREYLEKKKSEKRKDPGMPEDLIINGSVRAKEALIKLVERTEALGPIQKAVWAMTAELTIILALILMMLPKLLILTA